MQRLVMCLVAILFMIMIALVIKAKLGLMELEIKMVRNRSRRLVR